MQRFPATSCGGGINNIAVGGTSSRDTARADSPFSSSNFSVNQRRSVQLAPYKLTCDKEPLNGRLGAPDYYPQTPNCPEETLTKEYVQHGYRETVDGLEEAREITLSQLGIGTFTKPVVVKCKEASCINGILFHPIYFLDDPVSYCWAIRKRLRAINESRAQKRKAGQVYGVPLSGSLLTRPCVFPEQKACGEDFRRKWVESLSLPHKRLRLLSEHVPLGYRRKSLFEVLIKHNVPLLRATWFIKVTYLNQVRPVSSSVSSGAPDKTQLSRSELWSKDVTEYLQYLLDEFFAKDGSFSTPQGRDQSPQMLLVASIQSSQAISDGDEPSFHFKWWYMVRIIQWHYAEGLLIPSHIIDWVFERLQEKESFDSLQLLLPIVIGLIETIVLSQTYVRNLVEVAVRCIQEPSPGGSSLLDNSRRSYMITALVEMLRYLLVAVPDTFVALDCFPLPPSVSSDAVNEKSLLSKAEDVNMIQNGPRVDKGVDVHRESFNYCVSSVRQRADNLAKVASPTAHGGSVAKAVQALDRSLNLGDVSEAYNILFEGSCMGGIEESWIAEVSSCLRASLKWIGSISLSSICSVFFLCEWATCDFRDFRTALPPGLKLTGRKDFSQVHTAVLLFKLLMEEMNMKGANLHERFSVGTAVDNVTVNKSKSKTSSRKVETEDMFESPGPMHDILVCWIDQHDVGKGEGFKRLQLLLVELIQSGIFCPQAYLRQLIVSGILDRNETPLDLDRRQRHYQILKQLPGTCLPDLLKEARVSDGSLLLEAMHVYSNERCLVLHGLASCKSSKRNATKFVPQTRKDNLTSGRTGTSSACLDNGGTVNSAFIPFSVKNAKVKPQVAELKLAITLLLHLPNTSSVPKNTQIEDSQGIKRSGGSSGSTVDVMEGTDGCEDCRRAKRLKLSDERSSYQQGSVSNPSDDEDTWWVRKGPKSMDSFKVDPPLKSTKLASRGRQKVVRKTQSLAQLAAARIEGSQGASTSHVCDNKVSCPHHRNGMESEIPKAVDAIRATDLVDVVKIGKALKQLRLLERRTITVWLITLVRQLVEGPEKTAAKLGQGLGSLSPIDERNPQWKLDEDELSAILYLMDVSSDLVSAVKFLLWLLGKIRNGPNPTFHGVRSILMLPKNSETHACDVGEAFILSCIRRYESILVAANLLPEALSATMHRAAAVMVTNGRASGSSAFIYGRNLLKKYGNVASVAKWEKSFKTTCDQRLLAELESGRSLDGEFGFSPGVPAGVEDLDGYIRQKIASCRSSRAAPSMKEVVAKRVDEAMHYFYGKERKLMAAGSLKSSGIEKWDDGYQKAQQIVLALMECIRQNGGTAQEGDHSLVVSAVAAIVGSVGLAVAKMLDFTTTNNHPKFLSPINSLNCARRVVHIHVTCLCLLKEALGERQYRAFEIALATEASSAVAGAVAPGKASRSQFTESHDSNSNLSNENLNSSTKVALARATKAATAVSALVIGAVVHGVLSLDRMVTLFRLKEGLDILQFIRSARSNSNGISRSTGALKVDNSIEVNVHWFRLLIGNCRTISDGLVVELLGEPYILALSRMQRTLPISLVFPPAYSIFTMVIWRPYILNGNIANREDIQMYQSLTMALEDAMRHQPFRDVCLRDTRALYDNLVSDGGDSEFAAMLELHGSDKHLKTRAFVPLRARLFLNSILDCKLPPSVLAHGDGSWVHGHGESRHHSENETKLVDKLLHVLDTLQPAKFHWQWVDLRLLLNEQVLIDKIEGPYNLSLLEAVRSLLPNNDASLTDAENNFTDIVVTRLLVRPDAAPLYAEVLHLFGRAFEDSLSLNVKWFLAGHDVLYGRKSIRQRLVNIAQQRNLSTKVQFWRPWGWSSAPLDVVANKVDKMFEATSLEEGEVVEEGSDLKKSGKVTSQITDTEGLISSQPYVTEKALVDLVHACMDCISSDARNTFANDMIKQLSTIEQQISLLTGGSIKQAGNVPIGVEGGTASKSNNRKAMRGGSPGLGRRITAAIESVPPSSMALRASMWLRLQFLLRLLPTIYSDREPSGRSMRHMLATITLRLLGSRVVYVDADLPFVPIQSSSKRDADSVPEPTIASSLDLSVQSLFDQLLSVLYGLLSSWKPSWLKPKSTSKSTVRSPRDFSVFDREVVESLQSDLDRMQLPESVRWRLQAAMPVLPRFPSRSISCQPPILSSAALASLYSNISSPGSQQGSSNQSQRSSVPSSRVGANAHGKSRPSPLQDQELEIDPWTLLEDGTGSLPSSSNSTAGVTGDQTNLKACHWLKGAVRVRRTELTYIGAVDDDS